VRAQGPGSGIYYRMPRVIGLYLTAASSFSGACLAVLCARFALTRRLRGALPISLALAYLLKVGKTSFDSFLALAPGPPASIASAVSIAVNAALTGLFLSLCLAYAVTALRPGRPEREPRAWAIAAAAFVALLAAACIRDEAFSAAAIVLFAACAVIALLRARGLEPERKGPVRALALLALAGLPLVILDEALYFRSLPSRSPYSLVIDSSLMLAANLLFLLAAARRAMAGRRPEGGAEPVRETVAMESPDASPGEEALSAQERKVAELAILGLSNREIGERLFISPITVRNHLHSAYEKTGAANRTELGHLLRG
jgi:DNA-binding CsgD family transcriptional regulator